MERVGFHACVVFIMMCALRVTYTGTLQAQPPDVLVLGDYIDAVTGDTVRNGHVDIVDVDRKAITDTYHLSVYSGMDVPLTLGGHHMLYFNAPGYTTRLVDIDLSARQPDKSVVDLIELRMYIPLMPLVDKARPDTNFRRLGKCRFVGGAKEPVWDSEEAARSFTVQRTKTNERLDHSRALMKARREAPVAIVGAITDHWTDKPIADAEVHVSGDDGTERIWRPGANGLYQGELLFDRLYTLVYRAEGRLPKIVRINTAAVPDADRKGGFGMDLNMRLFADIPGEDLSFLKEPIGLAAYAPDSRTMAWDMEYTGPRLQRLKALLDRHAK